MRELRIHGRAGQGAVLGSRILTVALFREGRSVQAFPAFGVERRVAPVTAFLRVSERPIFLRCGIAEPDACLVLDATLLDAPDVTRGLKPGGLILLNSGLPRDAYADLAGRFRVSLVDASGIARAAGIGPATRPIVNTAMLGAFSAVSGLVGIESVCAAIAEVIHLHPDRNVRAARDAAKAVLRVGDWEVQHA
jgi:2-oxoacid:acceptor oxidoreductase gamma subunit (pyruvate/2-ketoisovalerate family)